MVNRRTMSGSSERFYFLGQNHWMVTAAMKLRCLFLGRKARTKWNSILKSRGITLLTKVPIVKVMVFLVVIYRYELDNKDHKEGWAPKNSCFQIVVPEKILENHLDSKDIKPVHPKENQPCIFTGRTVAEAEAPTLWPPDANSRLIRKDPDAWKD